ncbi:MAG: methyltransferase type 11 [Alphaproteobacteria bacterium]|nr:MAG: methyltransferase type 11 [Alphaproteobacteria bacterium]
MHSDVVDLRDFYATRLGLMSRHLIRRRIRAMWPNLAGETVLGLGYATPYLRQFRDEAQRVIAIMPAAQGVLRWPPEGPSLAALADQTELPLPDASVDRVLLVHSLEGVDHLHDMLREVWRVMSSSGRLLVVVPNRRGIWARTDRTPFGQGHPYSPPQLSRLLREHNFLPMQSGGALFMPPFRSGALVGSAPAWERVGRRWFPTFAGVILCEAGKQIYAVPAMRKRRRRAVVLPFPNPVAQGSRAVAARRSLGGAA